MYRSNRSWTPGIWGVLVIGLGLLALGLLTGTLAEPFAGDEDELGETDIVLAPASEYATINETTGELEIRLDGTTPGIEGDGVNIGYTVIEELVLLRNDGEASKRVRFRHDAGETVTFGAGTPGDIEGSGIVLDTNEQVVVGVWVAAPNEEPGSTLLETVAIVVDTDTDTDEGSTEASVSTRHTDLRIVDLDVPDRAQVGDRITVEATVENRGTDSGIGTIEFGVDNSSVTERRIVIEGNDRETVPIELELSRIDPGEYQVSAALEDHQQDAWLTVEEQDNDNIPSPPPAQPERNSETHVLSNEKPADDRRLPMLPMTVIGIGAVMAFMLLRRG